MIYSHGQEMFYKFVSKITNHICKTTLVHDCMFPALLNIQQDEFVVPSVN